MAKATKKEGLKLRGHIKIKCYDKDGNLKDLREIDNLIVSAGHAGIAARLMDNTTVDPFVFLALGTGSTAATASDTALGTEITTSGLKRTAATATRTTTTVTNDTLDLVKTFTATASFAVTECGIFSTTSSGGTMLGRQVFTAVNVANTDTLQITYDVSNA